MSNMIITPSASKIRMMYFMVLLFGAMSAALIWIPIERNNWKTPATYSELASGLAGIGFVCYLWIYTRRTSISFLKIDENKYQYYWDTMGENYFAGRKFETRSGPVAELVIRGIMSGGDVLICASSERYLRIDSNAENLEPLMARLNRSSKVD